jgi:hypothetical protein
MPWPLLRGLLAKSIVKLLGAPADELPFWRDCFAPEDLAAWPDNDIFNAERRKALRDMYPQAPVYTFHGAGHAPAFSRAAEYLDVLGRFME